jgi:hypothetical protein
MVIIDPTIIKVVPSAFIIALGISSSGNSYPLLSYSSYSKGHVYLLTIPDNLSDLYNLPENVLYDIKESILDQSVILEAKPEVSIFTYDNNTLIIHSFIDHTEPVKLYFKDKVKLYNIINGKKIKPLNQQRSKTFKISLNANEYIVLSYENIIK